jgi:hypothetical protein
MDMSVFKDSQPFYDTGRELLQRATRAPHSGATSVKVEPLYQQYPALLKAKGLEALILKQETLS